MLDLLSNIFDILIDFFDWVSNLFTEIIDLGVQVGEAVSSATSLIDFLPASVVVVLVGLFTVAITYKVLGREG